MLRTLCCVILLIVQRDTESTRVIGGWRTVLLGEDVDLSCRLIETDEELEQITWQKSTLEGTQNHNFMLINPKGVNKFISPNGLTGRVQFIGNPSENLGSIRITAVRLLDEGTFTCIFSVFPSGAYNTEIPLTVLETSAACWVLLVVILCLIVAAAALIWYWWKYGQFPWSSFMAKAPEQTVSVSSKTRRHDKVEEGEDDSLTATVQTRKEPEEEEEVS
uniref:Ig-like domain-containing protein n=1 Tax=Oncorhynchus kisutch TaxID=8019 RepID=A0A8C7D118_ONCKI